jgi:hypothetical protein
MSRHDRIVKSDDEDAPLMIEINPPPWEYVSGLLPVRVMKTHVEFQCVVEVIDEPIC